MSEPRFVLTEPTGYKIPGSRIGRTDKTQRTDYYVQDRLYLYAVVASFPAAAPVRLTMAKRKEAAERECDRLNAWWQEEMADGRVV